MVIFGSMVAIGQSQVERFFLNSIILAIKVVRLIYILRRFNVLGLKTIYLKLTK